MNNCSAINLLHITNNQNEEQLQLVPNFDYSHRNNKETSLVIFVIDSSYSMFPYWRNIVQVVDNIKNHINRYKYICFSNYAMEYNYLNNDIRNYLCGDCNVVSGFELCMKIIEEERENNQRIFKIVFISDGFDKNRYTVSKLMREKYKEYNFDKTNVSFTFLRVINNNRRNTTTWASIQLALTLRRLFHDDNYANDQFPFILDLHQNSNENNNKIVEYIIDYLNCTKKEFISINSKSKPWDSWRNDLYYCKNSVIVTIGTNNSRKVPESNENKLTLSVIKRAIITYIQYLIFDLDNHNHDLLEFRMKIKCVILLLLDIDQGYECNNTIIENIVKRLERIYDDFNTTNKTTWEKVEILLLIINELILIDDFTEQHCNPILPMSIEEIKSIRPNFTIEEYGYNTHTMLCNKACMSRDCPYFLHVIDENDEYSHIIDHLQPWINDKLMILGFHRTIRNNLHKKDIDIYRILHNRNYVNFMATGNSRLSLVNLLEEISIIKNRYIELIDKMY